MCGYSQLLYDIFRHSCKPTSLYASFSSCNPSIYFSSFLCILTLRLRFLYILLRLQLLLIVLEVSLASLYPFSSFLAPPLFRLPSRTCSLFSHPVSFRLFSFSALILSLFISSIIKIIRFTVPCFGFFYISIFQSALMFRSPAMGTVFRSPAVSSITDLFVTSACEKKRWT